MADGRADDHPEEIGQTGETAGIHGMTLCRTEKFQDTFSSGKIVLSHPRMAVRDTVKEPGKDAEAPFPKKTASGTGNVQEPYPLF